MREENPLQTVSPRIYRQSLKAQLSVRPSSFAYWKRKIVFQAILIICIIGSCILAVFAKNNPYLFFDPAITKFIQGINIYGFDTLMHFLSLMGNWPVSPLITLGIVLLFFAIKKRKDGLTILVSTLGISLISYYLKIFIARPRPDSLMVLQRISEETTASFPSGHVLFFIGLFGTLTFITFTQLKNRLLRSALLIIFLSLIILIGISRISLGVHWFSDVLGSYSIGFVWLYLIASIYRRF